MENGQTLINCLAYIDLNPVRSGIVEKPEDYRWNSIGYHIQANNADDFLSLDFGLAEFGILDSRERLKRYRKFLYEKEKQKKEAKKKQKVTHLKEIKMRPKIGAHDLEVKVKRIKTFLEHQDKVKVTMLF